MSARDHLSPPQVQMLVDTINSGGGFSIKAAGQGAGTYAENSFMVGVPGHGRDFPVGDTTVDDMHQFISDNDSVLRQPGMNMGGWQGSNPKRGSVDVAEAFPRVSWQAVVDAKTAAVQANQEAIGAVGTRRSPTEYQGDIKNPHYDAAAGHAGRAVQPHEQAWVNSPRATVVTGDRSKATLLQRDGDHQGATYRPAKEPQGKVARTTVKRAVPSQ
jgi:hypothetical protein